MGTRSLTVIHDAKDEIVVCLYRQYDGYPSGMGVDLKKFLTNAKIVNGYNEDEQNSRTFNGMGDLAARLITHLKNEEAATVRSYTPDAVHPVSGEDCIGQYYIAKYDASKTDYVYHITQSKEIAGFGKSSRVKLTCYDISKKKNVSIPEAKK